MTDQSQNPPNEVASNATQLGQTPSQSTPTWKNLFEKVKTILTGLFNRFYSNKKVFWPVSVAFGLILLVIILGLLFGRKGVSQNVPKPSTPSPATQTSSQTPVSGNILIDSQNKLNDLKKQITNLDVKQSRLKPPMLNFNIKF